MEILRLGMDQCKGEQEWQLYTDWQKTKLGKTRRNHVGRQKKWECMEGGGRVFKQWMENALK